jgi:hypothetical protein
MSFIAVVVISLLYIFISISMKEIPGASDFFGHSLGILGFLLMLMTETLYTIRKRSRSARWGKMSEWLQFHIFTGLVGPYLVLIHSSWKFNGLAGLVMLLTVVIVVSGFIGRYIYTAVPRSVDGAEIESTELENLIHQADAELQSWLQGRPESIQRLSRRLSAASQERQTSLGILFTRPIVEFRDRIAWRYERNRLGPAARAQAAQLEHLLQQRALLQRQLASLAMARRLLGLWHTIHIPIGFVLFGAAIIHIVGALYYATLLR